MQQSLRSTSAFRFYFDPISPYAWLAFRPLKALCDRHLIPFQPIPVLFAGLLNANGNLGPAEIPNKRVYVAKDIMRRAAMQGLNFTVPPHHPFNPLLALRVASLDMDICTRQALAKLLLDSVWTSGLDISDPAVLCDVATAVGLDGTRCIEQANECSTKSKLINQTKLAIQEGVFGVPTVSYFGEIYWGSDSDTISHIENAILNYGERLIDYQKLSTWEKIKPSAERKRYYK